MLNFSRLKIGFILFFILTFFYIFLGNFHFTGKTGLFLDKKINLGLDLQGGSYLLLEVDINPVINKKLEEKVIDIKKIFKESNITYKNLNIINNKINLEINNSFSNSVLSDAINKINDEHSFFRKIGKTNLEEKKKDLIYKIDKNIVTLQFSEEYIKLLKNDINKQSIEIIRKRVDELGTKEPSIQQKGDNRIIIELPGLSDPSNFKNILGKTAQLNFKFLKSSSVEIGRAHV